VGICRADGSRTKLLVGAMAKFNKLVEIHACRKEWVCLL
jgi:hypothetical protein